jgi:hypothetical protein
MAAKWTSPIAVDGNVKKSSITSLFALIQLLALIQIALALLGPDVWMALHRDLPESIARGGESLITEYWRTSQSALSSARFWGTSTGTMVLVLSSIGSFLSRRRSDPE